MGFTKKRKLYSCYSPHLLACFADYENPFASRETLSETRRFVKIEVINTGSELLLGHVTNTHLGFIGQELLGFGLRIERQATVPDGAAIKTALTEAISRNADLTIVTGGLGPTSDDITRDIAAELFGRKLILQPEIYAKIEAYIAKRHIVVPDIIRVQAMVPEGALVLDNNCGTAPGLLIEEKGQTIVLLPGPPRELKPMWRDAFVPWLRNKLAALNRPPTYERVWRILGIGESSVQDKLEEPLKAFGDFEFGYCARPAEVDFRLITTDPAALDRASEFIYGQIGEFIYAENNATIEQIVVSLLKAQNKKIATAESCTGGLVAHRITNVPGASAVFHRGWVTYSNEAKTAELGVPAELFPAHGAVSEEVVRAMAKGALDMAGADIAIALTGIAGPDGGTPEKPVGTVWIGVATARETIATKKLFATERETFKHMASQVALDMARKVLIQTNN